MTFVASTTQTTTGDRLARRITRVRRDAAPLASSGAARRPHPGVDPVPGGDWHGAMREQIEPYLDWLLTHGRRPKTTPRYRTELTRFCSWFEQQEEPVPTEALMHRYHQHLKKDLRSRSVRMGVMVALSWFAWLVKQGICTGLPPKGCVNASIVDKPRREVATREEIDRMQAGAERMSQRTERATYLRGRALLVLTLLRYTGLRRSELLALDVRSLRRDGERWWVDVRDGKGGHDRSVPVLEEGYAHLEAWLAFRADWVTKHGHTSEALIPVDRRRRLSHRGLDAIWDELLELGGVTRRITPHSMRHAFASELKRRGVPVPVIQALLGHQSILTTEDYLHDMPEELIEAVELLAPRPEPQPTPVLTPAPPQTGRFRRAARPRGT